MSLKCSGNNDRGRIVAILVVALVCIAAGSVLAEEAQEAQMVPTGQSPLDLDQQVQQQQWIGVRITLDTQNADIKSVLRIIAEEADLNIVAGDDVTGKITVKLVNVPWDQALDLILKTRQLAMVQEGNVIRIAPRATLQAEMQAKLSERQLKTQSEDLVLALIPVNYSDCNDMQTVLRTVMSTRGTISVDERTNVVIVRDVPENIEQCKTVARLVDRPTRQVLIESRIVDATSDFTRELGVIWGTSYTADAAHGNPTGLAFPNSVGAGYSMLLPAPIGLGTGAGLDLSMGSINNTFALDLQLSAMEDRGEGRVISQPKVTTLENYTAKITQGVSIPYSISTSLTDTTINTAFVDANLNMEVLPTITDDGSIIMEIKVAKNAPNTSLVASSGYAIDKKEAETTVLVMDGETTVIGGIFTIENSTSTAGIPWISRVPVLGFFFRDKRDLSKRTELLIFITPRIVRDKPQV